MDEKEIKIVLTEANFSQAVKVGRIIYILNQQGQKLELPLTSMDVRELCKGKILMRKVDEYFVQVVLATIDKEMIREILRRTPLYSSLAEEIQ
jgi:hypothetical protein